MLTGRPPGSLEEQVGVGGKKGLVGQSCSGVSISLRVSAGSNTEHSRIP